MLTGLQISEKRLAQGLICVVVLILVLASCAHSRKAGLDEDERVDAAACAARNGEVKPVCLSGVPACVTPFPDAGEPCRDSADCLGMCLVDEVETGSPPAPGTRAEGRCQADDDPCGCFFEVKDGVVQQGLCVD
jgi:hypothetical protein